MKVDTGAIKDKILKGAQPILIQLMETQKQVQGHLEEISKTLKEIPCRKLPCVDMDMAERVMDKVGSNAFVKQGVARGKAIGQNLKNAISGDGEEVAGLKERLARMEERLAAVESETALKAQIQRLSKRIDQLQSKVSPRGAQPRTEK